MQVAVMVQNFLTQGSIEFTLLDWPCNAGQKICSNHAWDIASPCSAGRKREQVNESTNLESGQKVGEETSIYFI